ncbi:quinolinate synthase NadA [Fodinibius salsisoli]|uniref:Quinolinate synthase n=1 Tax=Fodinibius salsisoli TaxID=2820877 RepID=A0ABT3PRU5_9BACT|nr:quinolinate synthase NadA [Fodinibius salsisoli]MCW9708576.1 quinolinate synthase NadA [Fodinibius salsisoli]
MNTQELITEVKRLKEERNAVILAHNYQVPEVQDIADYIGDSLGLSHQAAETDAEVIVFCGVHFMAETASIISPDKRVLIPDLDAGCSLADSITVEQLREWKAEHPDAVVVTYINTTAAIKAECDYCCTSSNAVDIVESIPEEKEVLFLPDKFLGSYVEMVTGRELNIWDGSCHVHEKIGELNLNDKQKEYPDAEVLIHPECGCSTSCMMKSAMYFDCDDGHIHSTSGMLNRASESEANEFVVATETGILHRMRKENPDKTFHAANDNAVCEYMKMITLEKLYESLKYNQHEVKVPKELAERAHLPIERMLSVA